MSKSQSGLRWHLSRGDEPSRLIAELELQLLKLGELKDSDLLWKPDQIGWQRADLIPGVLAPPLDKSRLALARLDACFDRIVERLRPMRLPRQNDGPEEHINRRGPHISQM